MSDRVFLKLVFAVIAVVPCLGCRDSNQLEGPLNNADVGREVGVDLTREEGGLGIAYTHDRIGNVSGAAFLVWRTGGPPWHREKKSVNIIYLPTGVQIDEKDSKQVEKWTIVEIEDASLKEMTPVVKSVPPPIFHLTQNDIHQALFLQITCGQVCDESHLHVRNRELGGARVFLWLLRDTGSISPL